MYLLYAVYCLCYCTLFLITVQYTCIGLKRKKLVQFTQFLWKIWVRKLEMNFLRDFSFSPSLFTDYMHTAHCMIYQDFILFTQFFLDSPSFFTVYSAHFIIYRQFFTITPLRIYTFLHNVCHYTWLFADPSFSPPGGRLVEIEGETYQDFSTIFNYFVSTVQHNTARSLLMPKCKVLTFYHLLKICHTRAA